MKPTRLCVTGHRPKKLFGYNMNDKRYGLLRDCIKKVVLKCIDRGITHYITGMALGVDTIFAEVVLELRTKHKITLECAIPCFDHPCKWSDEAFDKWHDICGDADKITYVSNKVYSPTCMQKRNEYMVDNSDVVLAIWDGASGGTANCIAYAKQKHKIILGINPNKL